MAQAQSSNSGFTLPPPVEGASAPAAPAQATTSPPPGSTGVPEGVVAATDTASRDLLVGGGILLVLFVGFFFAKNGYANALVARRVPPAKANAAGWWLFVLLACVGTGVVLGAVNAERFMTPFIVGPLAAAALLALVLMLLVGRK